MPMSLVLWLSEQISLLKQLPRTGWLHRGVPQPESVASHSYGVIFWTWWLVYRAQQRGVSPLPDLQTALLLALLHDLPEAGTGDLVPRQRRLLFGDDKNTRNNAIRTAEARFWQEAPSPPNSPPIPTHPLSLSEQDAHSAASESSRSPISEQDAHSTASESSRSPISEQDAHSTASESSRSPISEQDAYSTASESSRSPTLERDLAQFIDNAHQRWQTLQNTETPESRIVKQADKLDCLLQALFYYQKGYPQAQDFARLIDDAAGDDDELRTQLHQAWHHSL
ncbi:HD domain-containing protein [Myxococcota bacterium]|nr:HD domain-containing protein [Myxococcota bacterium]